MLPLVLTNHTAALILNGGYFIWLLPEIIHTFSHHIEAGSRANDHYSNVVVRFCLGVSILLANWLIRVQTWATISWHPILIFRIGIRIGTWRRGFPLVCDSCAWKILQRATWDPTWSDCDEGWSLSLDSSSLLYWFIDHHAGIWIRFHQLAVSGQRAIDCPDRI